MANREEERKGRRKALGRGLGALIPANDGTEKREFMTCEIVKIRPSNSQPRKSFDDASIQELAASIENSGLIQPLVVRQVNDHYELIAGERRWRACKFAGITEVPVVVKDTTDAEAFALALVENIQREDLNPIEEALAYQRLLDEFDYTQQNLAKRVGKSRSAVANAVRLLNLPPRVRDYVSSGELTAGHARTLATLPAEEAEELAEIMVRHGYSVREAEEMVRESKQAEAQSEAKTQKERTSRYRDDAQVRKVTEELQSALGTRVKVKDRHGKGRIEIHYDDYEILQGILDRLLE